MTLRILMDDVIAARWRWESESDALGEAQAWVEDARADIFIMATAFGLTDDPRIMREAGDELRRMVRLREQLQIVRDELEPRARLALRDYERIRAAYLAQQEEAAHV